MSNKDILSKFEWVVMGIIWEDPKIKVREVLDKLPEKHKKAYTTVQTYMERLVEKGFLSKEKIGRVNFYSPEVEKETIQEKETENFIEKTFNGSISNLTAFLFDNDNIDKSDLEQIREIISEEDENE